MAKVKLNLLAFTIICLCVFLAYSNAIRAPFIWDDYGLVLDNPLILSGRFSAQIFASDLYCGALTGSNFYRPLQAASFLLDRRLWQFDPRGYHLTNVILQAVLSCLVFLLLRRLFKDSAAAFAAALFFAISPLNTEAVTYIAGRAEMLLGLSLVSALLLFIAANGAAAGKAAFLLLASLFCFCAGLFSKELAVVFPLIIFAWVFFYRREKFSRRRYFAFFIFPFILISAVYGLLRAGILKFSTSMPPDLSAYPLWARLSVLPRVIFTYLRLLFFPVNLHMSRTLIRPVAAADIALSLFLAAIILAGCAYLLLRKRKGKNFSFLFFWALAFFLPQSGIFAINAFAAEHFIYLSCISIFAGAAWLLRKYLRRGLFIFAVCGTAFYYGSLTYCRNQDWLDPVSFYRGILKNSPASFLARNNLGVELDKRAEYEQAIAEFKAAAALKPQRVEPHANLASVYFKQKRFAEGEEEYKIVERLTPAQKQAEAQNNIAALYEAQGRLQEAVGRYNLSLRLQPGLKFARLNLARVYLRRGEKEKASSELLAFFPAKVIAEKDGPAAKKIISAYLARPKPLDCPAAACNDLGVLFARQGLIDAAAYLFRSSLELNPQAADTHFNVGLVYLKQGLAKEARKEFRLVAKLQPGHKAEAALRYLAS
jgi:tetratricopeptide (TPR) repeat protein